MMVKHVGRMLNWVVFCSFLVACVPNLEMPTQNEVGNTEPVVEEFITTSPIAVMETSEPSNEDIVQSTTEITGVPTPYLKVDSQLNLLPAGFYLVFYDLENDSLQALSTQIKTTTIASGNGIFPHSTNNIYTLVGDKLMNMHTRENFMITPFEKDETCAIASISNSGKMLVAGCEPDTMKVFSVGDEWRNVFSENFRMTFDVLPQLSPDDQQVAFCMVDPDLEEFTRIYKVNLLTCSATENCVPELISDSCDDPLLAWSPDAKMMAVAEQHQGIRLIDFVFATRSELLSPTQTLKMDELAWSPDGQRIAFTRLEGTEKKPNSAIYLTNLQGGEPRLFYKSDHPIQLVGWLNIISSFKPNAQYIVLPSETQYWMKDKPSHDAFNLKQMIPGEKVRVMDKSSVVSGEEWWQVRVGDFSGWVVENSLHFQDDWAYGLASPVFEPGRRLIVKISGNDLRLREMPSLNGAIKRYLQPGMRLKIIDGPAVVDKYNWWLVEIEESKILGWVVEEALWYASD